MTTNQKAMGCGALVLALVLGIFISIPALFWLGAMVMADLETAAKTDSTFDMILCIVDVLFNIIIVISPIAALVLFASNSNE